MAVFQRVKAVLDVVSTVAVLIVAGMLLWNAINQRVSVARVIPPETVDGLRLNTATLTKRIGESSIVLVEFADFECPYCAQHAKETFPRIKRELIEHGIVSYAFLHFPLQRVHRNAFAASEAAECARKQKHYWEMHERIFANQSALTHRDLLNHAESLGLDMPAFSQCMAGQAVDVVNADIEQGKLLGVTGTPAFFIGVIGPDGTVQLTGRLRGAVGFDSLKEAAINLQTRGRWSLPRWFRS